MTLGRLLRRHRLRLDLRQAALGERLGVPRQAINDWERDRTEPPEARLPDLARALGVSVDEFVTGRPSAPPPVGARATPAARALSVRLRRHRSRLGLTQSGLAARLGVERQAVNHWEAGRTEPSPEHALALARVFGITLDAMVAGDEEPGPQPAAAATAAAPSLDTARRIAAQVAQARGQELDARDMAWLTLEVHRLIVGPLG